MGVTMFVIIILFMALLAGILYGLLTEVINQRLDKMETRLQRIEERFLGATQVIKERGEE